MIQSRQVGQQLTEYSSGCGQEERKPALPELIATMSSVSRGTESEAQHCGGRSHQEGWGEPITKQISKQQNHTQSRDHCPYYLYYITYQQKIRRYTQLQKKGRYCL